MLFHLHVKNLALIDETDVCFKDGLNILTGETGAGKSILIGSINLALGQKFSKEMLRRPEKDGLVELVFELDNEVQREQLALIGVEPEENQVVLTRRMAGGRSISKINGEMASAGLLKETAAVLLDIHGQHEHQSLLYKKKHLEILDEYGETEIAPQKAQVSAAYAAYTGMQRKLEEFRVDETERMRELSFIEFEIEEIKNAALTPGEDEEVEKTYRRLSNGKQIMEAVYTAHRMTGYEEDTAAGEMIGRAVHELSAVCGYDEELGGLLEQLEEIDALLNDFNRELSSYEESRSFGEEAFYETEKRLNELNHIKSKYGKTIDRVIDYYEEKCARRDALENYEQTLQEMENTLTKYKKEYERESEVLSGIRRRYAKQLEEEIRAMLVELNFLQVQFEMQITPKEHGTANGTDEAEFFISTNPGEPLRPLGAVASGGELSRIMLAIKTVLAQKDAVGTMIFDEIDAGISGRTAQMVSEKMAQIAVRTQVLCITHLPQIAAMADTHFLIEKKVQNDETVTDLKELYGDRIVEELARMLGGAQITDAVLENAREMKRLAELEKQTFQQKMAKTTKL